MERGRESQIKALHALVVLTGAGISAESGLHTFRDADGIWAHHRIEDVATPEAFARDPGRVHEFYNRRRAQLGDPALQPNRAHLALVELERELASRGADFLLVTQNVDNLHQRAGSRKLLAMHGQLAEARCGACEAVELWTSDLSTDLACPACGRVGLLRPNVVWFGELPLYSETIAEALSGCDLFVAIGTSGAVYPAASFVSMARSAGARTIELNLEPSETGWAFDERIYGRATDIVPDFVTGLLDSL